MKKSLIFILFTVLIFSCQTNKDNSNSQEVSEENWIQLFNGKDLTGWTPKIAGYELGDNFGDTWRVEDGFLTVSYDQYDDTFKGRFGHLFYKDPFSYYRLRAEYRFIGEQISDGPGWAIRNNGLMFHCQDPATMALDQDFPVSLEAQLLGGNGTDERTTLNLCTPGTNVVMDGELVTNHCISSTSKTYHGEQWVTAELVVLGSEIVYHIMDGDTVLTYTQPQVGGGNTSSPGPLPDGTLLSNGYISIQSETAPIQFRKIEVLDLSKKSISN